MIKRARFFSAKPSCPPAKLARDSLDPGARCFRRSHRRPRRTAWSSTTVSTSPSGPWSTRPTIVDSPTARPASSTQAARSAATLRAGCAADTAAPVAPAGHASAACRPLFCVRVGSASHGRTWPASCGAAALQVPWCAPARRLLRALPSAAHWSESHLLLASFCHTASGRKMVPPMSSTTRW